MTRAAGQRSWLGLFLLGALAGSFACSEEPTGSTATTLVIQPASIRLLVGTGTIGRGKGNTGSCAHLGSWTACGGPCPPYEES